jgi:hypothetical protein
LLPKFILVGSSFGGSTGVKPGEDAIEDNFSFPGIPRLGLPEVISFRAGSRKLERKERGDLEGFATATAASPFGGL